MTADHDKPFAIEIDAHSFAELSIRLRQAGQGTAIGDDGVIRLGLARIRRQRPPALDQNGIGLPDGGEAE